MLPTTPKILLQEIEQIRQRLILASSSSQNSDENFDKVFEEKLDSSVLDPLAATFGLTLAEQQVLLLCIAIEIVPDLNHLCAKVHGNPQQTYATLELVQKMIRYIDFQILLPESPLHKWQLIQVSLGSSLSQSPIRIDPTILSYALGQPCFDSKLVPYVTDFTESSGTISLPDSYKKIAAHILRTWKYTPHCPVQLTTSDAQTRTDIALTATTRHQHQLYKTHYRNLPTQPNLLQDLILRWQRHTCLTPSILLLDCGDLDTNNPDTRAQLSQFIERLQRPVILSTETQLHLSSASITHEVPPMTIAEQRQLWMHHLDEYADESLHPHLNQIATHFNLTPNHVETIAQTTIAQLQVPEDLPAKLWKNCRNQTRSTLESFAQRIDAKATWNDLVLSKTVTLTLEEIIAQMRNRHTVYEDWELAGNSRRGLGITALFFGASGTGKTTSAEIIAHELDLDLYRVDLSKIVSKFIGETEKNLSGVFAGAERTGAVLQFDEADVLLGKRSDVKDARDRDANMEVSYLLQRMEAYSGLAILTTNLPKAMDSAFQRRIRFSIRYELPDQEQRAEIWRRTLSNPKLPTADLSIGLLSQINMSGANLQNIVRTAAFTAAEAKTPIRPQHILAAAQSEALKMGRSLMTDELYGWPTAA
jgi:hypothetical protein